MEINEVVKSNPLAESVMNKEGGLSFEDSIYKKAVLQGASLNIKTKKFYFTEEEILNEFVKTLEEIRDKDFLVSLAKYLAYEHQRKLSPSVIAGYLLSEDEVNKEKLKSLLSDRVIFKTPKQMAETLAFFQHYTGKSIKNIPSFAKRVFRKVFESYNPYTLKKSKLRRRKIKTADLIKVLRPKPSSEELSKIYRAIVENDSYASLKTEEHITTTLSSTKLSQEEKKKIIFSKVERIPINSLVRNLSFFSDAPRKVLRIVEERLSSLLRDIEKGNLSSLRVFNVTDLLIKSNYLSRNVEDILSKILLTFLKNLSEGIYPSKFIFIFDLSGSMLYPPRTLEDGIKFLTLSSYLYPLEDLVVFDTENASYGKDAKKIINATIDDPLGRFRKFVNFFEGIKNSYGGGTSLHDTIQRHKDRGDDFIVISDEVSWADDLSSFINNYNLPMSKKFIFFNPAYVDGKVAFKRNVLRVSSLSSSTFKLLSDAFKSEKALVRYIKENY